MGEIYKPPCVQLINNSLLQYIKLLHCQKIMPQNKMMDVVMLITRVVGHYFMK